MRGVAKPDKIFFVMEAAIDCGMSKDILVDGDLFGSEPPSITEEFREGEGVAGRIFIVKEVAAIEFGENMDILEPGDLCGSIPLLFPVEESVECAVEG